MIACKYNYSELIDLLLRSRRVDPNIKDEEGNIFLHYLVQHPDARDLDIFDYFMIDKNNEGVTPLDLLKLYEIEEQILNLYNIHNKEVRYNIYSNLKYKKDIFNSYIKISGLSENKSYISIVYKFIHQPFVL